MFFFLNPWNNENCLTSVQYTLGQKTLWLFGGHRGSMLKVSRALSRARKSQCNYTSYIITGIAEMIFNLLTTKNEIPTGKAGDPGFVFIVSSNFGAFHSDKGWYRTKKTQTDSCNHQSPAGLNVACECKIEVMCIFGQKEYFRGSVLWSHICTPQSQ